MVKCSSFASMARDRVTVQEMAQVGDEIGGSTSTWQDVGTYWAYVRPVSDGERYVNQQLRGEVSHKVTIRFQSLLENVKDTAAYRLLLDGRIHDIRGIKNLFSDMKRYGKFYQELSTVENAVENTNG